MVNFIARVVRDPALAQDLAQETFVKAFTHLDAFDPARRFSSWLLRIAHNTAVDALRRVRVATVPLDDVAPPRAPDVAGQADLARALEAALGRVRPEYRAAVVLRYHDGYSYDQIAEIMGVPEGTAKTFVHRGRKELAALLEAAGWRPA